MKICLLGEYSGNFDEGMKNTTFYLSQELINHHEVLSLNPKDIFSITFWRKIKRFNPQIIHYIPGPSIKSFVVVKALAFYCKNAKTVMSALHPYLPRFFKKNIPLLKPDLVLVQSSETEKLFKELGCETEFLPSGVDIKRFIPIPANTKEKLREKCGVNKNKFVVLHVGHITKGRNLQIFKEIQGDTTQVIIVGSTYANSDKKIEQELMEKGCMVWTAYFENIEEIYALSDCYLFPTTRKMNSIEIPLSVLEAMSCNLPVISTKFGGLNWVFKEGKGLFFIEKEKEFFEVLEKIRSGEMEIKTREKVLFYSWENITKKIEEIYTNIAFRGK